MDTVRHGGRNRRCLLAFHPWSGNGRRWMSPLAFSLAFRLKLQPIRGVIPPPPQLTFSENSLRPPPEVDLLGDSKSSWQSRLTTVHSERVSADGCWALPGLQRERAGRHNYHLWLWKKWCCIKCNYVINHLEAFLMKNIHWERLTRTCVSTVWSSL